MRSVDAMARAVAEVQLSDARRVERGQLEQRFADELASALRDARKQAGVSQSELSKRWGVPRPNVSRLERGCHMMSLATFCAACRALTVDPVPYVVRVVQRAMSAA